MRIVAGTLRGRVLEAPSGDGTRPTTDRVREALFSSLFSLRGGFEGAVVLDAFAGSGALGIEALSRGANKAVFFESNAKAAKVLERNVSSLGLGTGAVAVFRRDVLAVPPTEQDVSFDLVFLDPPYAYDPTKVFSLVRELAHASALLEGSIVVYEHDVCACTEVSRAAERAGCELKVSKKYGKTGVTLAMWPGGILEKTQEESS